MLGGLAAALIREERIRTTEAKAKRLRPVADKLVTLGKSGTVHSRRMALKMIEDREVVHKLFAEVAPRFADRRGGYTRVLKLGPRKGDAAPMAIVEFVEELEVKTAPSGDGKRRGLRRRKKGDEAKPAEAKPAEAEVKASRTKATASKAKESKESPRATELVEADEAPAEAMPDESSEVFMTGDSDAEPEQVAESSDATGDGATSEGDEKGT
jgi:large subunit ribosomal protein L17